MKTLSAEGSYRRVMGENEMSGDLELYLELPDKFQRVEQMGARPDGMPGPKMAATFNGSEGWMGPIGPVPGGMVIAGSRWPWRRPGRRPGGGPGGAPGEGRGGQRFDPTARVRADFWRTALALLPGSSATSGLTFSYVGKAEAPDGQADVLEAKGEGNFTARLFVDAGTHLPIMISYMDRDMTRMTRMMQSRNRNETEEQRRQRFEEERKQREAEGPPPMVEHSWFLADYKKVDGVQLPHRFTLQIGDKPTQEWEIKKFKINPTLDAEQFKRRRATDDAEDYAPRSACRAPGTDSHVSPKTPARRARCCRCSSTRVGRRAAARPRLRTRHSARSRSRCSIRPARPSSARRSPWHSRRPPRPARRRPTTAARRCSTGLAPGKHVAARRVGRLRADRSARRQRPARAAGAARDQAARSPSYVEEVEVTRDKTDERLNDSFSTALTQEQIDALPDDEEEMQQQLEQMAGPGAVLRVNGFSGGRLPPKSQIAEIRFRFDPYSAEYHEAGFPRVDIRTRPGNGTWRSSAGFTFRDESLNARNAFAEREGRRAGAPLSVVDRRPAGRRARPRSRCSSAASARSTARPSSPPGAWGTVTQPNDRLNLNARVEHALTKNQMLRVEYSRNSTDQRNLGVGAVRPDRARL